MFLLDNVIQPYAWGSKTAIADLQGRPSPSAAPEAELWMGAHPAAPSRVPALDRDLLALTTEAPERVLGSAVRERFGGFPFLLKVLAAEQPLSIQAHPSKAQAEAGFADEEARGIALSAPHRNYKDPNHKPELLCALSRFEALCGFRSVADTMALIDELGITELAPELHSLSTVAAPEGLRDAFRSLMSRPPAARDALLAETTAACASAITNGRAERFASSVAWTLSLADRHPGDVGAVSALFLNHLVLDPGEAVYLPAGNMHAYLSGVGVEIMASSDNVLRGGLTPKNVDVSELLRVLVFTDGPIAPLSPKRIGAEHVYETPAPDFRLARIDVAQPAAEPLSFSVSGPEILLCVSGSVTASSPSGAVTLGRGQSALALAAEGSYRLHGTGTVYRASVG